MRHGVDGYKPGRLTKHRAARFRNMLVSLFRHERITTTEAKAKAVRGLADHCVTLAKREQNRLHARRQVLTLVPDRDVVARLFDTIAARYGDRHGGYTRIVRDEIQPPLLIRAVFANDFATPFVTCLRVVIVQADVIGAHRAMVVGVGLAIGHPHGVPRHAVVARVEIPQQQFVARFIIVGRLGPRATVLRHVGRAEPVAVRLHRVIAAAVGRQTGDLNPP